MTARPEARPNERRHAYLRLQGRASPRRSAWRSSLINLFVALFAPWIAPFDQSTPVGDPWADPNWQHWLGLDNLGRDMLSRLIYGARMTIGLALVITALSFSIGIISGFAAAVAGGWVDQALSRLVDLMLSMPTLIFAFVVLACSAPRSRC